MTDLVIEPVNEVYIRVNANPSIKSEMSEYFSFFVPGYKFMPTYKNKVWDGRAKLYNMMTGLIYKGLLSYVLKFAETRKYSVKNTLNFKPMDVPEDIGYSLAKKFGYELTPRDFQNHAVYLCLKQKRKLILSPTASGKSLIISLIAQSFLEMGKKVLIIVPNIGLVKQLAQDIKDYNNGKNIGVHKITGGVEKNTHLPITISTWQSIVKQNKKWFDQFDCVMGDECFHPDTLITMGDGSVRKIKNIHKGDIVRTVNEKTGKLENKPVVKLHKNLAISNNEKKYKVATENGKEIVVTGNHKIFTQRGWVRVDELLTSDSIRTHE